MKNALSSGYSGGSGSIGFEPEDGVVGRAVEGVDLGRLHHDDVGDAAVAVDVELQHHAAAKGPDAASGTNQLRRTCATKRRIHGPNSTPLVSNWIAVPGSVSPPCGLLKVSFWT